MLPAQSRYWARQAVLSRLHAMGSRRDRFPCYKYAGAETKKEKREEKEEKKNEEEKEFDVKIVEDFVSSHLLLDPLSLYFRLSRLSL
jgi:hypothetical protein